MISVYLSKARALLTKAVRKGALDIFVSSLLNKVFMLLFNVLIIRFMEKGEYGVFTYAYNIITIILIVSTLGIDTAMMQFCCENRPEEERLGLARFALPAGIISNLLFSVGTFAVVSFVPLSVPEGKWVLMVLAFLLPLPCILNYQKFSLRIIKDNRRFGLLTNIASGCYLVFSVIFIIVDGLRGLVIGRYLAYLVPMAFGAFFIRKYYSSVRKARFPDKALVIKFIKYGLVIAMTNGISELLYYADVYVVGLVTTDTLSIASYKCATVIPNALAALPAMLMIFVYPYFAYRKDEYVWVKKHLQLMQAVVFPLCVCAAAVFILLAPWIIDLLYGSEYADAVVPFRILCVSFVFSASFRVIGGNILAMLGKVNANFVMGCVECVLNLILDYVLIKMWGGVGAAIATFSIIVISSLMTNIYLYTYLGRMIKKKAKESAGGDPDPESGTR